MGRELAITKPKKLPWTAVPKAPRTRSPRSRWLARLTGPMAQHRSLHGQQVLTHIIVMHLATGIRAFRLGRRCLNLGSNAVQCGLARLAACTAQIWYMPVMAHHDDTSVDR